MTRAEVLKMLRRAGFIGKEEDLPMWAYERFAEIVAKWAYERFAEIVAKAERNKVAQWMIDRSYATGHGDTTEDLLDELDWQITESWSKVVMANVEAEREACAKLCEDIERRKWEMLVNGGKVDKVGAKDCAEAIRARGEK